MQYEAIILELMTRIKALEDTRDEMNRRIDQLEEKLAVSAAVPADIVPEEATPTPEPAQPAHRQKISEEMIEACYHVGVRLHQNPNLSLNSEIDRLSEESGMNRSSAIMYVYAVKGMLEGEAYKRAISLPSTERFFQNIARDFGEDALATAVHAAKAHNAYRQELGQNVDGLVKLCARYEAGL